MSESNKLLVEALGALMLIAGFAVINIALGLVAAGVLFILAANFADAKEPNDAGTE